MLNSLKWLALSIGGLSFGLLAAAGVFTVLVAVGLVPRFAGKTNTGKHVVLYEEMVIAGTIVGGVLSLFEKHFRLWEGFAQLGLSSIVLSVVGNAGLIIFGIFAGMFVGCLALAIAEMLDSIPIFTRRIGFRHGLGIVIVATALGKLIGSLLFFIWELHEVVK